MLQRKRISNETCAQYASWMSVPNAATSPVLAISARTETRQLVHYVVGKQKRCPPTPKNTSAPLSLVQLN